MASPRYHTNILFSTVVVILFIFIFFINSRSLDYSNISSTITCSSQDEEPKETALRHLMFVLVSSSGTWKNRRIYTESWWRPNVTRGNIFFDKEPSKEFQPWSPTSPPLKISQEILQYSKREPFQTRIYRTVLDNYKLMQNQSQGVRWYVMGDDDTLFFQDNLVNVLSKYDHKEKIYIGMYSETIKSNYKLSYEMAFGGGGFALSFPLVEAFAAKLDECSDRYHNIYSADYLTSVCLYDVGANFFPEKGFHQMDILGDVSGLLSSHSTTPLLSLHHFDKLNPFFPNMDRPSSVLHLMKAANVDQSRILQQSICYVKANNWTFSVSWGYSVHIYEKIFSRSQLMRPIETFSPWLRGTFPLFMFNTRPVSRDPCEAPHWFFFDSIFEQEGLVVTSYTRKYPRNMTSSCSNISADSLASIKIFSPKTPKQARKMECCNVEYEGEGAHVANIRLRDCLRDEIIN